MVRGVVAVVARLEEGAELDRLVRLVVVHGPGVQPRESERQARHQRERDQDPVEGLDHFPVPYTSTST
jgi:hypothetical protein